MYETRQRAAQVYDFIARLPRRYEMWLGENAGVVSGRPALDVCASALDPANAAAALESMYVAKVGRLAVVVMDKLQAMSMCNCVLVVHDSGIAESGTYGKLMAPNGQFAERGMSGRVKKSVFLSWLVLGLLWHLCIYHSPLLHCTHDRCIRLFAARSFGASVEVDGDLGFLEGEAVLKGARTRKDRIE